MEGHFRIYFYFTYIDSGISVFIFLLTTKKDNRSSYCGNSKRAVLYFAYGRFYCHKRLPIPRYAANIYKSLLHVHAGSYDTTTERIAVIMGAAETVFIILASNYKTAFSLENDIFNTVASLFFSLIIMATANRLRCRNYAARMTLEKLSRTDALTGLLNKISFEKRAAAILSESGALYTFALIVLDIDDFKLANDTYGHPYGDRLLNEVGELLLGAFRKTDPVGRIGGDEFAVLMCGSVDEALIEKKYEALKKRLELISIDGIANHATCSVGAVIINQEYATYEELFRIADEALYQVKREGKSAIKIRIGV